MSIQDIIQGKKEWRAHMTRVKALPEDYQLVYKEIQKYLFKVGPIELTEGIGMLSELVDLFGVGAHAGKDVLEVTGSDVAAFCDELIKDSRTYTDIYKESTDRKVSDAMKKITSEKK
jgi:DNA-binding ferritin-like protein (Dps family)